MAAPALKSAPAVPVKSAMLDKPVAVSGAAATRVIALPARKPDGYRVRLLERLRAVAVTVIPPLVVVAILMIIWQIAFSKPGSCCTKTRSHFSGPRQIFWNGR